MSWVGEILGEVSGSAVDIFKAASAYQATRQGNTLNDLQNQVQLLSMQRDLMNQTAMQQAAATQAAQTGVSRYMPLILVAGVALVAVMVVKS